MLPIWEQGWPHFAPQDEIEWPDFNWPHTFLLAAEQVLDGKIAPEQIHELMRNGWDMLEYLFSADQSDEFQQCICVAAAASETLGLCLNDNFLMLFNSSNRNWREVEIDWYSCDPAQWASMANPGGTWDKNFDRDKSLEFWTW